MDNKTIVEKINSLHSKILSDKFAEKVYESEMLALIEIVHVLENEEFVKHGHTFYLSDCSNQGWYCSICGKKHPKKPKYCSNCGAKMDLE